MSTEVLILMSVGAAVALVVVLAIALIRIRVRLTTISEGLGKLGSDLATVESQHLRPLEKLVNDINGPLQTVIAVLPVIAGKAALVAKKSQEG